MSETIAASVRASRLAGNTYSLLKERVETAVRDGISPALSLAVFYRDSLVFDGSWGWIDPETRKIETTPDTLFDLASVTKIFTTIAFLSLVSDEQVSLYAPLASVVPEFAAQPSRRIEGGQDPHTGERLPVEKEFEKYKVNAREVTFFHLLTHTGGLAPWRDLFNSTPVPPEPPQRDALARAERWSIGLKQICAAPFVALPDSGVRYSDLGLMLLGEAVARLHDEDANDLQQAIQQRVLRDRFSRVTWNPMQAGYQREEIAPTEYDQRWRKRRVWGEVHDENSCGLGGVTGHAGLFASAREVALLGNIWLNHAGRMLGMHPELAVASVELQAQSANELRGLGWMLKSPENSSAGDRFHARSYGHTGFTGTSLWIDPNANLVVALLTNRVYPGREVQGIADLRRSIHDILHAGITG
jgi:CubicO group peptidase (beta-lactamase class C family)